MDDNKRETGPLYFDITIVLHNFFNTLKRLIWIALLVSFAVGVFFYVRVDRSFMPIYSSSVDFSVHASYAATTDILSYSDFLNSNAAAMLSNTFPYVIQSENTSMLMTMEMGRSVSGTITASSTADSGLFTMTAISSNPQDAFDLIKAAIAVYPQAASSVLGDTQIRIINMPLSPPARPDNENEAFSKAITVTGISLFACMLAIFLLSLTRRTVHSSEDLRKLINLKCLAYVPKIKLKKHSKEENLKLTINNPRVSSTFSECIRNLRVKLQKVLPSTDGCKVLMITSTLPNEGKSTVAVNLALSLAAEGKRVLLVDGDLRKQALKEAIGIQERSVGLVEILSGKISNFHLLTVPKSTLMLLCGDETTNLPQPLIDTPKMKNVLDRMREMLDYVIIDTPPAGILSDAATLAKYTDATLYVVRQDLANTSQILDSIQVLSAGNVNIVGCVLNQAQAGTTRYGYSSKYSDHYGYNYGYKYSDRYGYYGRRYNRYSDPEEAAEVLSMDIADAVIENDTTQM